MPKPSSKKVSSSPMSTKASQVLKDGRYGATAKSLAGSVLAQSKGSKKK